MLFALSHALLPWDVRRGATTDERERPLDGDAIIAHPTTGYTLAITIHASPEQVWPWVVQMGQGRGGFYTHTWIENLLGADIQNADRIMPALLELAVGDTVRLTPNPYLGSPGQFMLVAELVPPRVLVYEQTLPSGGRTSWALVMPDAGNGLTRLIARRRGTNPSVFDRLTEPGYVSWIAVSFEAFGSGRRRLGNGHFPTPEICAAAQVSPMKNRLVPHGAEP